MANCSRIPPTHFNPRFPCGERQPPAPETAMPVNYFNPRPHAGGRRRRPKMPTAPPIFQSMFSMQGITRVHGRNDDLFSVISTLASSRERHFPLSSSGALTSFQSTPPLRVGDCLAETEVSSYAGFQSTPPVRGRQQKRTSLVSTFVQSREYSQVLSCFRGIIQDISSENNSAAGEF